MSQFRKVSQIPAWVKVYPKAKIEKIVDNVISKLVEENLIESDFLSADNHDQVRLDKINIYRSDDDGSWNVIFSTFFSGSIKLKVLAHEQFKYGADYYILPGSGGVAGAVNTIKEHIFSEENLAGIRRAQGRVSA